MVRSRSADRHSARTSAIGLRREPQPPMPIVMPLSSAATTSSTCITAPIIGLHP